MSKSAAFQASYADFKLIKGRKCAQIILEVAIEAADAALEALGGVPQPHRETWVGVARIEPSPVRKQLEASVALIDKSPSKERRAWSSLSYAEQAGIRCNEPAFWQFLSEEVNEAPIQSAEEAALIVRTHCGVESRSEIKHDTNAGRYWVRLDRAYEAWLRRPTF